jgi:hypothetical protein
MRALLTVVWAFAAASAFSRATPQEPGAQKAVGWAFFVVGAFFPAFSLLTCAASFLSWRRHKKYSSPAFVPFVGPIVLSIWVFSAHKPLRALPLVWLCDVGTIAFLWASPRLISDLWQTSSFTRVAVFEGTQGMQSAVISIHSTGRYLLEKKWRRQPGEGGISAMGEVGDASEDKGSHLLKADNGWSRTLQPAPDGLLQCVEDQLPKDYRSHSIADWRFREMEFGYKRDVNARLSKILGLFRVVKGKRPNR